MPDSTYVVLCRWTDFGTAKLDEAPTALKNLKKAINSGGGRVITSLFTQGAYDVVVVFTASPDHAAAVGLALTARGDVTTTTLTGIGADEVKQILSASTAVKEQANALGWIHPYTHAGKQG